MIPKRIHYCWFGGNKLPESALKYIESWKIHCPDYEIKEWNESNFDVKCNRYVKEAFEAKKWAFITDYVRLHALISEGGIYMDTDVEVIKPLDEFLHLQAFSGFENTEYIPTGIMACEKGFPLFSEILHSYDNRRFVMDDGSYDVTTNVETITEICKKYGFVQNNSMQTVEGFTIYPKDWFCPKDYFSGRIVLTENTHTIHHFSGTWKDQYAQRIISVEHKIRGRIDGKLGILIAKAASLPFRIQRRYLEMGMREMLIFSIKKLMGDRTLDHQYSKTKL